MGYKKSNYGNYSTLFKVENISKSANITNILKRNKIEEKKEKLSKFFTLIGSSGLVFILAIIILL